MSSLDANTLRAIPKVELHRHLDGSVRFETIIDLAKKYQLDLGIDLSNLELLRKKTKITSPMNSLGEVLDTFWTTQKVMCNYDAIKRIAFENVEDCFRDGVKLSELRFAPTFIAEGKKLDYDEIIEAVIDGVRDAKEKFKIEVGLIHIIPRALSLEKSMVATKKILEYKKNKGRELIVGFDLADGEKFEDIETFIDVTELARDAGLGVTVHSGEDTTANHVIETINKLKAQRIGHGIKIFGNDEAIQLVKDKNVHLEVCPTSNWLTKCVEQIADHPIKKLLDRGVSVSINSDDPHIMNIDLVSEYLVCQKYYSMNISDFKKTNLMALKHSFLSEDKKESVGQKYFS